MSTALAGSSRALHRCAARAAGKRALVGRTGKACRALLLCFLAAACGDRSTTRHAKPNVLLIVVDTLRQDALGCYGNRRALTPALDKLAGQGVLFADARTSSPWTLPAHASLFTSLFPDQHGAVIQTRRLAERFTTVAEVLQANGYRTVAHTDGGFLTQEYGLLQGFEIAGVANGIRPDKKMGMGIAFLAEQSWQWIQAHTAQGTGQPFFLFCHTYEVHDPYAPDQRFRDRLVRPYSGTLPAVVEVNALKDRVENHTITEEDRRYARDLYDAEVAQTDEQLGKLFERLDRAGILDSTLVIVTSDHGEEFGEHVDFGHRNRLFETLLRVPLIVRYPGWYEGGTRVEQPVRLVDVAPSILEVAGLPAPPDWIGKSLSDPGAARELLFSLTREQPDSDPADWIDYPTARGVLVGDRKSTWYPPGYIMRHEPTYHVFDLRRDPGEQHNLWTPDATAELQRGIEAARARHADQTGGQGARPAISEEEKAALRALGYVK